jgi:hypothetical protein
LAELLALGTCWMLLCGPATESATYVLLAPTLAWAVLDACTRPRPAWVRGGLLGCYGALLLAAAAAWFPVGNQVHTLGVQPLAALVLFLILLVEGVRAVGKPERGGGEAVLVPSVRAA